MKERIQIRISKDVKKILQQIAKESGGKLATSELVSLFIYEGLDNRGFLPESVKAKVKDQIA